jgi:hypothetical protein
VKVIICAGVFLLMPGLACADDMGTAFSGLSVSLGADYQASRISQETVRTTDGVFAIKQPDAAGRGLAMQIQTGYAVKLGERFSISANAYASAGSGQTLATKATFFADSVVQKVGPAFGIFVAPGVYVTPRTLVFAKAGYGFSSWDYRRTAYGISSDKRGGGVLLGVGIKQLVSDKIFIGADLTRHSFRAETGVLPLSSYTVQASAKVRQTTGTLSVGYLF